MTPKDQIIIIKAFEAITMLSRNTVNNVLFAPETTLVKNTENIRILKLKMAIIENVLSDNNISEPIKTH